MNVSRIVFPIYLLAIGSAVGVATMAPPAPSEAEPRVVAILTLPIDTRTAIGEATGPAGRPWRGTLAAVARDGEEG